MCEKCRGNYYITTPFYYPSAKLHIGHAYCTVATDTMARFQAASGYNVSSPHRNRRAWSEDRGQGQGRRRDPQQFVDDIVTGERGVLDLWKLMNISYDRFIRTTGTTTMWRLSREFLRRCTTTATSTRAFGVAQVLPPASPSDGEPAGRTATP